MTRTEFECRIRIMIAARHYWDGLPKGKPRLEAWEVRETARFMWNELDRIYTDALAGRTPPFTTN